MRVEQPDQQGLTSPEENALQIETTGREVYEFLSLDIEEVSEAAFKEQLDEKIHTIFNRVLEQDDQGEIKWKRVATGNENNGTELRAVIDVDGASIPLVLYSGYAETATPSYYLTLGIDRKGPTRNDGDKSIKALAHKYK